MTCERGPRVVRASRRRSHTAAYLATPPFPAIRQATSDIMPLTFSEGAGDLVPPNPVPASQKHPAQTGNVRGRRKRAAADCVPPPPVAVTAVATYSRYTRIQTSTSDVRRRFCATTSHSTARKQFARVERSDQSHPRKTADDLVPPPVPAVQQQQTGRVVRAPGPQRQASGNITPQALPIARTGRVSGRRRKTVSDLTPQPLPVVQQQ